jgi:voltage-gated potassium channel
MADDSSRTRPTDARAVVYAAEQPHATPWRRRLYVVIFDHDTRPGKTFDVALLIAITASIIVVMLESVPTVHDRFGLELLAMEWAFTLLFTVEYVLRLLSVRSPRRYALSFFGIIDLIAIVPTYLSFLVPGTQDLIVIRALRLLRVFRILKLSEYLSEARLLVGALRASRRKITVFLFTVLTLVIIVGALMYLVEGPERGFSSIPISVSWAIVTLTTVGYGDIAPQTPLGRLLAAMLMITGYGIIAVPTGIVTAELVAAGGRTGASAEERSLRTCSGCNGVSHDSDAMFCKRCGARLPKSARARQVEASR